MKKFIVIFLLLVAVLLAVPGVIGYQAESRYQGLVEGFKKGGLQVTDSRYQRSWFSADAETDLTLALPADPDQPESVKKIEFTLRSEIIHGPLATAGSGSLAEINSEILVDGEPLFPDDYPASLKTLIGYGGDGTTLVDMPRFDLAAKQERPGIQFEGVKGEMRFGPGFNRAELDLEMPGLQLISEAGERLFEMGRVKVDSRSSRGVNELMLGSGSLQLEALDFRDVETGTQMRIEQAAIEAESSAEGEAVSGSVVYALERLVIGDQVFGPAELKLSMTNLSAMVLARIQQAVEEMRSQQLPEAQQGMAMLSVLMGSGPEFLKSDPGFAIDKLNVRTPEGVVDAHFEIQSVGLQWQEIGDMGKVLGKLKANASLQMPEHYFRLILAQQAGNQINQQLEQRRLQGETVEEPDPEQLALMTAQMADQQLQQLLQQQILLKEDGLVQTRAELSDGLLSVNGKMVPIPVAGR